MNENHPQTVFTIQYWELRSSNCSIKQILPRSVGCMNETDIFLHLKSWQLFLILEDSMCFYCSFPLILIRYCLGYKIN